MRLARVFDVAAVNAILINPAIADQLCDDLSVGAQVSECESLEWIGVYVEDQLSGVFLLVPKNGITVDIHTALLPTVRGKQSKQAGKMLLDLIFSRYHKAVTSVPENNRVAAWFAGSLGFRHEGVNRQSFLKNGVLLDQIMMGITREDYLCQ